MDDPKRRIVLVLPDLRMGGAQRVLLLLAKEFLAAGRQVDIVSLVDDGQLFASLPEGVSYLGLTHRQSLGGARLVMASIPKLVRYLRARRPDAILSSVTGTNLLTAIAHMCCRYRGRLVLREAASLDNVRSCMVRWLMRLLYRRADKLIAVSNGVADDLVELGLDRHMIQVIHNPVDATRLHALAAQGEPLSSLRKESYIISIGRLTEQKDHRTLLRAYAMSELHFSHRLVIVGGGEAWLSLEALAEELGIRDRVDLLGVLPNPYRVLKDAVLHVLSSRWEGYPNVLLEALALGIPVVATDCPAGPSELLGGGRYGRLAPVGDFEALAQVMVAELQQPATEVSEVLKAHHPSLIAKRYLAVLDGIKVSAA